ncbi:MDR family MFS transporter [Gorillibacterium timonense]|uniref:MDR family MFS transporter n=1 Tax=Gorillibacterium timonense TaxID=1689269 RepID=UPI00071CD9AB|nr:MDR family MFS transporter [Gorillibacterium timonense]
MPHALAKPTQNRLQVLISIVLAMLVASMDTTIINTTMPIIVKDLGGYHLYAWAFASYMIFSTVLTPIAGRISDLYGRKNILAMGIIVFLFGSLLCGLSQTMLQLILFRAIQGIGAGIMNPFPAIIAGDLYPIEERGKIQALFSAMWGISAVIAPLFGAMFTEYATWRWIFYINIPICLLSLFFLRAYKEEYEPRPAAVDYGGAALFTVGVSLTLAATAFEKEAVWLVLSGVAVLALFVWYERRQKSPIVPLSLFRGVPIRRMNINAFLSNAALFGTASYAPTFLQEQGHSTFISGVALLAQSVGWMLMSVPAGKLIMRFGYAKLMIVGNILLVLSGIQLYFLTGTSSYIYMLLALFIQGMAFGILVTVTIIGAQQFVDGDQKGVSTSLMMFSRNIGTAVGVTVMGSLLTGAAQFMTGIHNLFLYGLIVSVLSLATSFLVPNETPAAESTPNAA